ncbi:deoxyribose-phosphate aldolase [Anaeromyxobacter paludicola]|uniref:Deoxyribose-phosphate aldolase n=1 Tax=Anaeromyxobacter paludicola TaxID=2918171 RepID=A0ABN6N8R9_9BACT|nr:deoxyribose-phosphate aldolase [Anaeromyxobacter paludicola]BDG08459.1 deoxyribose-phosphate aldolase [Anaeromyxobacter paludicola]
MTAPVPGLARLPAGAIRAPRDLAPLIDHTLLREDATPEDVARACAEARAHGFATVCVRGGHVARAAELLEGSPVLPIAVVDFHRGEAATAERVAEARRVVAAGAREVDLVLALGLLRARDHRAVLLDLEAVVRAVPVPVKVILETAALTREEKVAAAALCAAAGAAFVKTSTGYGPGGATAEDVALLREVVGDRLGVKASGGIRTAAQARAMVEAGASRVGASASVAIVTAAAF